MKGWNMAGRAAAGILAAVVISSCPGGIEENYSLLPVSGGGNGWDGGVCLMAEKVKAGDDGWLMLQKPELPNGCEVTSLAMALAAAGYPADKTALFAEIPLGRAGTPAEVAAAVRFLAESPYITGETLVVSGGWR